MSYHHDSDHATRGVGAIAARDMSRAVRRARGRQSMGHVAGGAVARPVGFVSTGAQPIRSVGAPGVPGLPPPPPPPSGGSGSTFQSGTLPGTNTGARTPRPPGRRPGGRSGGGGYPYPYPVPAPPPIIVTVTPPPIEPPPSYDTGGSAPPSVTDDGSLTSALTTKVTIGQILPYVALGIGAFILLTSRRT